MRICLAVPLAPDEVEEDTVKLIQSLRTRAEVYFGVDEDYPHEWPKRYGHVIRVRGFGVGRALDAVFNVALRDGCDVIVRTDNHVYFPDGLVPPTYPAELPIMMATDGTVYYGSYRTYRSLKWRHVYRPSVYPVTNEPVMVFTRDLLELMSRVYGCWFCAEYWGGENLNISAQSAELGYPLVNTCYRAVHRFRGTWPERRVERELPREPWMYELPEGANPYFAAVYLSYEIYILRHYPDPSICREHSERWAQIAKRYFPDRARNVGDVGAVYRRLGLSTDE